jgi:hypothetical protein
MSTGKAGATPGPHRVARPSVDAMETAAEWLDMNEGEQGEAAECHAVAAWLRAQVAAAQLREVAKAAGVSVPVARAALAQVPK